MTRHRSKSERIEEILEAAAAQILSRGYAGLTMDAIARRTSLSKAGIYRFFPNKAAVALELFRRALRDVYQVDVAEVLAWNLPVQETILMLLFSGKNFQENNPNRRILFLLLLEADRNETFRRAKDRERRRLQLTWITLVQRLAERDGIRLEAGIVSKLNVVLDTAETFMVGLSFRKLIGAALEDLKAQFKLLLQLMIRDVVESAVVPADAGEVTP